MQGEGDEEDSGRPAPAAAASQPSAAAAAVGHVAASTSAAQEVPPELLSLHTATEPFRLAEELPAGGSTQQVGEMFPDLSHNLHLSHNLQTVSSHYPCLSCRSHQLNSRDSRQQMRPT